ncbi:hypothetical protein Bca52824_050711 [Brassica carinata]|uniref:Uncharacterized protein n=1 Tax=Brassica carinata TaxID=52824 RepID=A0A8X7R0H3_BRACI|nr:hypothetical protein Bca52824_050711 [Brassica carinata]
MVSALVVLPGVEIIRRLIQELRDQSFTLQQVHGTTVAAGSAASSQVTSEQPGVLAMCTELEKESEVLSICWIAKKGMAEINSLVIVQSYYQVFGFSMRQ